LDLSLNYDLAKDDILKWPEKEQKRKFIYIRMSRPKRAYVETFLMCTIVSLETIIVVSELQIL